jgi:4-hydroxy-tetrahydrodipicolinate synthase
VVLGRKTSRSVAGVSDLQRLPEGVGAALVTVFAGDAPDAGETARRAERCAALGVSSMLVAGTTGEASRLSVDDRLLLASAVRDAVPDVPVVVGTGRPRVATALEATAKIAAAGVADAVLVFCPAEEEVGPFYRAVRGEAAGCAVLAYHNPGIGARELSPPVLAELAAEGVIDGVKDSSASTSRLADLVALGVRLYVGSPTQLALAGACGAAGALVALANVAPTACIAAWNGDMAAQRRLFGLHRRAVAEFPAFLKTTSPE